MSGPVPRGVPQAVGPSARGPQAVGALDGGGCGARRVNASGPSPLSRIRATRAIASVTVGRWPHGHPPQREVEVCEAFEPLPAPGQHLEVVAAVGVLPQRLDRLPDRAVDQEQVVVVLGAQGSGVGPVVVHQAPDEAGSAIGEGVDLGKLCDEVGQLRTVERGEDPPDVDLGKVEVVHGVSMPARTSKVNEFCF